MAEKPLQPVKPTNVELIFMYPCPACGRDVPTISPVKPALVRCDACQQRFPIVPVDERTIKFFKIMLAGGKAGIDPDFM
jgi:DNA-directed RNA polymerase subunit RPC12/RpoP